MWRVMNPSWVPVGRPFRGISFFLITWLIVISLIEFWFSGGSLPSEIVSCVGPSCLASGSGRISPVGTSTSFGCAVFIPVLCWSIWCLHNISWSMCTTYERRILTFYHHSCHQLRTISVVSSHDIVSNMIFSLVCMAIVIQHLETLLLTHHLNVTVGSHQVHPGTKFSL